MRHPESSSQNPLVVYVPPTVESNAESMENTFNDGAIFTRFFAINYIYQQLPDPANMPERVGRRNIRCLNIYALLKIFIEQAHVTQSRQCAIVFNCLKMLFDDLKNSISEAEYRDQFDNIISNIREYIYFNHPDISLELGLISASDEDANTIFQLIDFLNRDAGEAVYTRFKDRFRDATMLPNFAPMFDDAFLSHVNSISLSSSSYTQYEIARALFPVYFGKPECPAYNSILLDLDRLEKRFMFSYSESKREFVRSYSNSEGILVAREIKSEVESYVERHHPQYNDVLQSRKNLNALKQESDKHLKAARLYALKEQWFSCLMIPVCCANGVPQFLFCSLPWMLFGGLIGWRLPGDTGGCACRPGNACFAHDRYVYRGVSNSNKVSKEFSCCSSNNYCLAPWAMLCFYGKRALKQAEIKTRIDGHMKESGHMTSSPMQ